MESIFTDNQPVSNLINNVEVKEVSDKPNYVRNPEKVKANLKRVDKALVTEKGCKIQFPKDWVSGKLGSIESNVSVLGMFAYIVDDQYYAVSIIDAKVNLFPDSINTVTVDDVQYLELVFEPGSIIMETVDVIKDGPFVFFIYDEIIAKGKTPWYMSYTDLGEIFDTVKYHAGVDLKQPHAIIEMLSASRARNPKDRAKYYRNMLKKQADYDKIEPDIIQLRSVAYGADSTTAKLLGAYLQEGISSALVNPTETVEKVEDLLLK